MSRSSSEEQKSREMLSSKISWSKVTTGGESVHVSRLPTYEQGNVFVFRLGSLRLSRSSGRSPKPECQGPRGNQG